MAQRLLILGRFGKLCDTRVSEALDVVEEKRLADCRWRPGGYYWRAPGTNGSNPMEVVDRGRGEPSEMITLNALRVLKAAGRLAV